ncbi:MAG TPA: cytochrome c-type biogenesis protein [Steroidobacteraceae bacterium]|jgi:cytochrome c-type biogenesis protein CcmH
MKVLAPVLFCWLLCTPAFAVDSSPPIPDPVLQQRYLALTHELRCMQCQNESLADSPVGLAADLRRDVREQVLAGETDDQIRDRMVARYGEFILFRPRMNWRNAWLWGAPALFMLAGLVVAVRVLRDKRRHVDDGPDVEEPLDP